MKRLIKKLASVVAKLAKLQTNNTPAPDKLAHAFWGDVLWSNIGYISSIYLVFIYPSYLLVLIPILTTVVPAASKELSDGKGFGNKEFSDFLYTLTSLPIKALSLLVMVYLQN